MISPYSAADAKGLLKSAIRDPNPVIFLEHEILYGKNFDVPDDPDWTVPIGKAKVVREGSDVAILPFDYGWACPRCRGGALQAGDQAEVVDLRTLRPLDTETIVQSVKTNRIVSVEEGWPVAGMGSRSRR